MSQHFEKVIEFANILSLDINHQDDQEELIMVSNEDKGIYNLVIDCEFPILIMEQLVYEVKTPSSEHFRRLLQMNRNLVHGAFCIDEEGKRVIFRDTLQLPNLDFNEFEGSINALSLGMAEYATELISLNA